MSPGRVPVPLRQVWSRGRVRVSKVPDASDRRALCDAFMDAGGEEAAEITCVVFSKNRPMQLDACLRSIQGHAPYHGPIIVVYEATSAGFRRGYAELEGLPGVRLQHQGSDFRGAVMDVLRATSALVVFHADDDLFFRTPPRAPLLPENCAAFSLRLGENTTYCYPFQRDQQLPTREQAGEFMIWDWANSELDFAYPMSLDGHLFDADLIRALVSRATFRDPNELERELHLSRYRASRLMAAFRHSCVVSAPLNVVTDSVANRSGGDPTMAPEALNELFLGGTRIDLSRTDFQSIRGAHQEIGLAFSDPVSNPRP